MYFKLLIVFTLLYSPFLAAASSVDIYKKAFQSNTTQHFYPDFIDHEWTPESGTTKVISNKNFTLNAYELYSKFQPVVLREGLDDMVLSSGATLNVGEVIRIETPLPSFSVTRAVDTFSASNWESNFSFSSVPSFSASGESVEVLPTISGQANWIDDLSFVNRDTAISYQKSYTNFTNSFVHSLSTFLELPDISISISGDAALLDLGDNRYLVQEPGSISVEILLPEVLGEIYYILSEEEISRIIEFYNSQEISYEVENLLYARIQDFLLKTDNGYAVEKISFSGPNDRFLLPSATVKYTFSAKYSDFEGGLISPYLSVSSPDEDSIYVGTEVTFEYGSASPVGIDVLYKIEWNNSGVKEVLPADFITDDQVNYVNRTYTEPGEHNLIVYKYAYDTGNDIWEMTQAETSLFVQPNIPSVSLESRVNTGSWNSSSREVTVTDTIQLRWSSSDADTCTGTNFSTAGAVSNSGITISLPEPGSSQTYTLTCSNVTGDSSSTVTITVLTEPPPLRVEVTSQVLSSGFDHVTGNYDTYTINTNFINNTGSAIPAPVNYTATFDNLQNGTIDVSSSGSVGSAIPPGGSVPVSIVFSDIPFGPVTVTVSVDYPGFNGLDMNDLIPPPNPGLQLNINPAIAPAGRSAELTWSMLAQYPMECTITGGEVNYSFDPSLIGLQSTEPVSTGRLRSMMTYRLRCVEPITSVPFADSVRVEVIGRQLGR